MTLFRTTTGYVLRDPLFLDLCGIHTFPLPFTAEADLSTVARHVQRCFPGAKLRVVASPADEASVDGLAADRVDAPAITGGETPPPLR